MKFVLIVVAVLILVWWLRGSQRRADRPSTPTAAPPDAPEREAIVACAQCGLMLPRGEALPGRGGVFCSEAHRKAFEHAPPA